MNPSVLFLVPTWLFAILIFSLIIAMNWVGFLYKKQVIRQNPDAETDTLGPIEGSMLGLMALLLAFTFNMAEDKFENRRSIIIEEANAISTAILRTDLYPDSTKNIFKQEFVKYIEARIAYYEAGDDETKIQSALRESEKYSGTIWKLATSYSKNKTDYVPSMQMIPALNAMIDIVTTRDDSRIAKVQPLIFWMLLLLTIVSAFLSGYAQNSHRRNWVMILAFASMTTLTLYLVVELDRPRRGLITLEKAEQKIVDLKLLLIEKK